MSEEKCPVCFGLGYIQVLTEFENGCGIIDVEPCEECSKKEIVKDTKKN